MGFWIATFGMIGLIAALLVLAVWRRGSVPVAAGQDLRVYRDQLAEVDRDLSRGVIAEAEAERLRTEVSRRLLEADRVVRGEGDGRESPALASGLMVGAMVLVLCGSLWAYGRIGAPGYPDLPRAARIADAEALRLNRPLQAAAEAEVAKVAPPPGAVDPDHARLMEQLRERLAERPDDLQGQSLLAQNEAGLGNFAAAAVAQGRVVALMGDAAGASDYAQLADMMILAADGYVSPEAEAALTESLRRDPADPVARYYSGLMFAQIGRPDLAFRMWRALLAESKPDDPWLPPIRAQIEQIAAMAGVDYELPPETALKGPTAEQMDAAADMTPEERMAMIGAMVEGLQERLSSEGGSGAEWARLIGAYNVMGDKAKAEAAWTDAQKALAGKPDDLRAAEAAAKEAGVAG